MIDKEEKNFEEVVEFLEGPGVRKWQFRDEGIKLINIKNIVDDNLVLDNTDKYLSVEEVEEKYPHFLLEAGDYVMASSGVTWGKIAEVKEEHLPLCLNTSIIKLKTKNENILTKKYLYYFIKSSQFKNQINRLITGSAQPNFGPSHLKQVTIMVPSVEEQEKCVEQLEQINELLENKVSTLNQVEKMKYDIFYKMFGNPSENEKKWETALLEEYAQFYNGKAHEKVISDNGKYIVVNAKYISTSGEVLKTSDSQLFPLYKDDIVMVMSDIPNGKALAKCIKIDEDDKYTLNQRICAFRTNKMNKEFLKYLLNRNPYFLSFNDGNGQTNLRKEDILKCPIIIPPIDLQNEFEEKIKILDEAEKTTNKIVEDLNNLLNIKMHEYYE